MKGFSFFISLFFLSVGGLSAQSVIRGEVVDAADKLRLSTATVMLVQAEDSILVDFVRANESGKFQLSRPKNGDYLLIVSYPKYGDFATPVAGGDQVSDLGQIGLQSITHLIEEVIVTGRIPIVIKGDTTEYDAGSFTVEKNAKVEDLLKVLPGITVDASGKITAQGKTVEKVLVDGEEFFGDDPVLVTRNIRSDMVDKIQVYEKKSDQAERTGVDDGKRTQTINVKLKEEAKKGIFGKVEAGIGEPEFYLGQGLVNYFNQSLKVSAFAIASNNGKTGLSWEDSMVIGDDAFGDAGSGQEGIPNTFNSGLLYADKSKDKKHSWKIDYKFNTTDVDVKRSTFVQNSFRDTVMNSDNKSDMDSHNKRHNVSVKHESAFDSLTTLTIWAGSSKDRMNSQSHTESATTNQFGSKLNENRRDFLNESESFNFNVNSLLTRKFKKVGRSLSLSYNLNGAQREGNQNLYAQTLYYQEDLTGRDTTVETIDQLKTNLNSTQHNSGSLTYSEPLTKSLVMSLEYKLANDFNHNRLESFNRNEQTQQYDVLDELYSNDFEYNTWKQTYNVAFNYDLTDNISFNLANYFESSDLSQTNRYNGEEMKRSFFVFNPVFGAKIDLTKSKNLTINYRGDNSLPSLDQIQPLRSNVDPLNEYLGNENLRNDYTHNLSLGYSTFNILKGAFWGGNLNLSSTKDALIQNVLTDMTGKNTYIWENMSEKNNNNLGINTWYYTPLLKKLQIAHGLDLSYNYSKTFNYINQSLAQANNQSYGLGYSWRKSTTKGLDFDVRLSPSYSVQQNSIGIGDSKGFIFNATGSFKYFLPAKFQLGVQANYLYQAPTEVYADEFKRLLVHPEISKKFLKDETLVVTLLINDVFNQNVGFSRNQNGTQLTERRFNTIGRYFMLRCAWDINRMFVKAN